MFEIIFNSPLVLAISFTVSICCAIALAMTFLMIATEKHDG